MHVVIENQHEVQADTNELTDTGFKPKILGSANILPLCYQVFGHICKLRDCSMRTPNCVSDD